MEDFTTEEYERLDAELAECQRERTRWRETYESLYEDYVKVERERDALAEALRFCIKDLKTEAVLRGCDPKHGMGDKWWPSIEQAQTALAMLDKHEDN